MSNSHNKKRTPEPFEKSEPEYEGIHSKRIYDFLSALEKYEVNIHSILLIKNFKLVYEGYSKPYISKTMQRMYSITKSFVSAAVGILAGKGKINLDEPIINYFEEYDGICKDKLVRRATVKHLLKMQSPHMNTAFKQIKDDDYVRAFFRLPGEKIPGTIFSYDTSASHTLCALAEKISGKPLLDFLRDEFLREAGFSEKAYCIKDSMGRSMGGSGLVARPIDAAILAGVFLNSGRLWKDGGNRQVIPEDYAKEAVMKHAETFSKGAAREEQQGYGYQFWRTTNNGYMCYGNGGQIVLVLPDHNFIMAVTADTLGLRGGTDLIFEAFWEKLYPYLSKKAVKSDSKWILKLLNLTENLEIKPLKAAGGFSEKEYTEGSYIIKENPFGIRDLFIIKEGRTGGICFQSSKGFFLIRFGIDRQVIGNFPYYGNKYAASGVFTAENQLFIKCCILSEDIGTIWFQVETDETGMGTLLMQKNIGTGFEEFNQCYIIKAANKKRGV